MLVLRRPCLAVIVLMLTLAYLDVALLGVLLGVIIGWTLIMTLLGPENVSPVSTTI